MRMEELGRGDESERRYVCIVTMYNVHTCKYIRVHVHVQYAFNVFISFIGLRKGIRPWVNSSSKCNLKVKCNYN